MKQILQDLKSGQTILEEVPVPKVRKGQVLIKTHRSLVSLGTERMLVEFGQANWIEKARQQPEKVRQVLDKIKADGLQPTMQAVFRKLGEPLPLGYCNAGEVMAVGSDVTEFKIGDRVASNGHHAEMVMVPKNLVANIPDAVSYEEASFAVVGAIALQGIRLIKPTFGETVVVTGLGLIGLIATQLLQANGCRVIGLDYDKNKVALAESWGVEAFCVADGRDVVKLVEGLTQRVGADAVLITASTKKHEVIAQAAGMSRKRGRIVLVGVIGLNLKRSDFYEKELSFQVSCSYGPGRYDTAYEIKGQDYPLPFVRWTEKRNFEAVLHAMRKGQLQVQPLITAVVDLEEYHRIYGDIADANAIGAILKYSGQVDIGDSLVQVNKKAFKSTKGVLGIIGAGNFTKGMVLPILSKLNANIKYLASAKGVAGTTSAKKYNIPFSTTDYQEILSDEEVDAVLITTQHHLHAQQIIESLQAGKHVFVEKPLAITSDEILRIMKVYEQTNQSVSVGFNRRFSPLMEDAKKKLGDVSVSPIQVIATMNAGYISADHWTQDLQIGGGRIIGEACHLIDLITYLTDSLVTRVVTNGLGPNPSGNTDNASILLQYQNGANAVINYFSNGHKSYSKERIEVYSQGRVAIIDNFRKSKYYGFNRSGMSRTQDKGHFRQFQLFLENLKRDGTPTIPFDQIINTSRVAIASVESLQSGEWVDV